MDAATVSAVLSCWSSNVCDRRYLDSTPATHRPAGVVFVDLDNDEVYLGYDDDKMVRTHSPATCTTHQGPMLA